MEKQNRQAQPTATRFAQQGESYSDPRVECKVSAKVGLDVRASNLALLAKNL